MDLENTGKNWREEAPLLVAMERKNPFTVPENYFNTLMEDINSLKAIEEARFSNEDEFPVPANYFNNLPAEIESRISEQELRNISTTHGFSVPENYFTELGRKIKNKTESAGQSTGGVIKPIRKNWIRYAAAASITLALGSVFMFNDQSNSIESQLNSVSDQEIVNYLQMNSDMSDTPIIIENLSLNSNMVLGNSFSDAELEQYINTSL